jgi:DNA transformation protein and related proteins
MAVDPALRAHVREQIGQIVSVTDRGMFGAVGIFTGGRMFGLISGDTLYLKADDQSRGLFLAAGSFAFDPYGGGGPTMSYYAIPSEVIRDLEALRPWVERAVAAAARTGERKRGPRKRP